MIASGDRVLLWEPESGRRWLVQVEAGARKEKGLGVYDPGRLIEAPWGSQHEIAGKSLVALRPTSADLHGTVRRKAQIITAKDMARIAFELAVGPGDRVLESGVGSAAATVILASAVGADGKVVAQELRDDFAEWASTNLAAAGLADRVDIVVGDLTEALVEPGPYDAVLLDQPEPWKAIPNLAGHLAAGARMAVYTPQVSQMEAAARTLADQGFAEVRAMELIERQWEIKERGSRPSFDGLGHTAFLVFARWPSDA